LPRLSSATLSRCRSPKRWETDVIDYLRSCGYQEGRIFRLVGVAQLHGTMECLPDEAFLHPGDRAAVEALLPDAPVSQWWLPEHMGLWSIVTEGRA
jgi:hypothetical protein